MTDIAIAVESVSKSYLVGHNADRAERYTALRDIVVRGVGDLARKTRDMFTGRAIVQGDEVEEFWALKDVSFEVRRGEVVGIIGRNGAGKSTLLKVLSRITEPSAGQVTLAGRVASLLEVGTGFHPELTGRENIFLNGAILGMGRAEITRKFDEIVAFAEVERFIDTPVKRYSSGMYVRLAFAVAAHLEPEILVIDEVLAVGDQQFQQKCLGKINDVASRGRTVLVVSHNMSIVSAMCDKAVLLDGGRVKSFGPAGDVLESYARLNQSHEESSAGRALDRAVHLVELKCKPEVVISGGPLEVSMRLAATSEVVVDELCLLIYSAAGERVAIADLRQAKGAVRLRPETPGTWQVEIPRLPLVEGDYSIGLFCKTSEGRGNHYDLARFAVTPGETSNEVLPYASQYRGFIELDYRFRHG
jgi:lipopolysaccharide transport system ATP-binding protein